MTAKPTASKRKPSLMRRILFRMFAVFLGFLFAGLLAEGVFRILEWREASQVSHPGAGGRWEQDNRWGWRPSQGAFRATTAEFAVDGFINSLDMNDDPVDVVPMAQSEALARLADDPRVDQALSLHRRIGVEKPHDLVAQVLAVQDLTRESQGALVAADDQHP